MLGRFREGNPDKLFDGPTLGMGLHPAMAMTLTSYVDLYQVNN